MAKKFAVVWTRGSDKTVKLLSVDEDNFADTAEEAKAAGRKMLVRLKTTDLTPLEVLELDDTHIEELITSDRETHEFGPPEDVLDFIQLAP